MVFYASLRSTTRLSQLASGRAKRLRTRTITQLAHIHGFAGWKLVIRRRVNLQVAWCRKDDPVFGLCALLALVPQASACGSA